MIKIKCIICDDVIDKPRTDQLCCEKPACKEEFNQNQIELWKMEHPDKVKEQNKRAYDQRKDKSAQPKTL